jgi:hypothetical protein
MAERGNPTSSPPRQIPASRRGSRLMTVDPGAHYVAVLAHELARHVGSVDAAVDFMRSLPGCPIEIPSTEAIEAYAAVRPRGSGSRGARTPTSGARCRATPGHHQGVG